MQASLAHGILNKMVAAGESPDQSNSAGRYMACCGPFSREPCSRRHQIHFVSHFLWRDTFRWSTTPMRIVPCFDYFQSQVYPVLTLLQSWCAAMRARKPTRIVRELGQHVDQASQSCPDRPNSAHVNKALDHPHLD